MKNYDSIRAVCEENSRISSPVIDEFLIYFAASRNNLDAIMNKRFAFYKHVVGEFKKEWVNRLKAQYLAHAIFKRDGTINKLLNHPALKRFNRKEIGFLEQQAKHAWRFSFSIITDNPAEDFYIMEDILSYEQYTLFSPGTTNLIKEQSATLWFNLIGYNGACWQTYGPIGAYKGFDTDDVFFFATELRPKVEGEEEIQEDIERNPVPYMMLLSGSNYPLTVHKEDQLVQTRSEYSLEVINTKEMRKNFKVEYNDNVYRLTLKGWEEYPHFAHAYFDEKKKIIVLTAATDRGFHALASGLNQHRYNFSEEPFIRVNTSMLTTAKNILKKDIELNEYDQLFHEETSKESQEEMDKLNTFMGLILPDINAGRKPDIEVLAKKAGIDIETARDLVQHLIGKLGNLGK